MVVESEKGDYVGDPANLDAERPAGWRSHEGRFDAIVNARQSIVEIGDRKGIEAIVILSARERTTPVYVATLFDQDGEPIAATDLTTVTLKHYDLATLAVINGRDNQNILNVNDVTIDENGVLTWVLTTNDTVIVQESNAEESHVALFRWTWASGTRAGNFEEMISIKNVRMVT